MFQLILVVLSIALVGMFSVATVNYLPGWTKEATDVDSLLRSGLGAVEQVYDVASRAQDGVPPSVTAQPDGGFSAAFLPYLRITPPTPAGYTWSYGLHAVDTSQWSGLNYFCLSPAAGTSSAGAGKVRGVLRAKQMFSSDQLFLSSRCGDTVNEGTAAEQGENLHITFFVAYTPGVTR